MEEAIESTKETLQQTKEKSGEQGSKIIDELKHRTEEVLPSSLSNSPPYIISKVRHKAEETLEKMKHWKGKGAEKTGEKLIEHGEKVQREGEELKAHKKGV